MRLTPWIACAGLLALPACYSSAHAARIDQTRHASGWACTAQPRVRCGNRADGRCTGWDTSWSATCPDDQSEWICRLSGRSSFCRPTQRPAVASRPAPRRTSAAPAGRTSAQRSHVIVRTERDEFTGATAIQLESESIGWDGETRAPRGRLALVVTNAELGALGFHITGPRWRWLECHHVALLVDGHPLPLPDVEHRGDVGRGYVSEHVWADLDRSALVRLTGAEAVRARICNDTLSFSTQEITALHEVGKRMTELWEAADAAPQDEAEASEEETAPAE